MQMVKERQLGPPNEIFRLVSDLKTTSVHVSCVS